MKNNTFSEYVKPVIVLVVICFVVTLALAYTYGMTKPVIDKRSKADADQARSALIKGAKSFSEYKGDFVQSDNGKAEVTECFAADNNKGYVMTVKTQSFGGPLTMMVGIDGNGSITGIKVTTHADTPGVGTKNFDEEYLSQYVGLTELHDGNVKADDQIDAISGASVTGGAIHTGVEAALKQYEGIGGEAA